MKAKYFKSYEKAYEFYVECMQKKWRPSIMLDDTKTKWIVNPDSTLPIFKPLIKCKKLSTDRHLTRV
jgi:hypothetical protein